MRIQTPFPEVDRLLEKYETEPEHVFHVASLTLQLFDLLAFWHQLPPRDRDLLLAAALLHDIGWSQTTDGRGHHKETLRLIDLFPWDSVTADEKNLISQCARYHRKSIPHPGHDRFMRLPVEERFRLEKLSSLLRIGDALDRTHRQLIQWVEVQFFENEWRFLLSTETEIDAEIKMAELKSDLLRKASGRTLVFGRK
jgi:exopolyphosphatase/guanosine-5'-triphosphate,3'-diphosphate pyrophosphatase